MRDRPWDLKPAEGVRKPLLAEAKPVELPILLIPAEVGTAAREARVHVLIERRTDNSHSNAYSRRMMGLLGGDDDVRTQIEARKKREDVDE